MKTALLTRRQQILAACAPVNGQQIDDRAMRAAVFRARDSEKFKIQQSFDRAIVDVVQRVELPSTVAEWLLREKGIEQPKWTWKRAAKNPAVVASAIAVIVIAAVFVIQFTEHLHDFPGSGRARKLLDVARSPRSVLLDPVRTEAGALGDLFFMKHNLEHYEVPPEFADFETLGCRVFDDEEAGKVAQIWVVERHMQFFLFPAERDTKRGVAPDFSGWRFVEQEGWTGAVLQRHGVCFMAVLRGDAKEFAPYLKRPAVR
jgi:hypothetical protein